MTELGTILLTSPRPDIGAALADALPGLQLLAIGSNPPAIRIEGQIWCFVDWLLPDISGLEMCRRLRIASATAHSHITMVLEEHDSEARRRALRAGADDYLVGPLTPETLISRLQQYRSGNSIGQAPARLALGSLTVDLTAQQARWEGRPVPLRPNEFRLLAHFVEHPDQVFTRTSLIAMLGKDCHAIDERTVDVWVGRLRRALKSHGIPDPLRTVRSMGYVLDAVEADSFRIAS